MKIYFLSSSAFSDNQISILSGLSKTHDITYSVIVPHINSNYTQEELIQLSRQNNLNLKLFQLKYRFRDPRVILSYLSIINSIVKEKPDVIYFTNFDQLYLNLILLMLNKSKTIIAFHDVENHSGTAFNKLGN